MNVAALVHRVVALLTQSGGIREKFAAEGGGDVKNFVFLD